MSIIGTFEKKYAATYTTIKFNPDSIFNYQKSWDIDNYQINGKYQIIGDTIVLNSTSEVKSTMGYTISIINKKLLIINNDELFDGSSYDPKVIYVGAYFNRKKE